MRTNGRRKEPKMRSAAVAALASLLVGGTWAQTSPPDVFISEFMASNSGKQTNSVHDELGNSPDWIELCNAGVTDESLTGWFLTDNATKPAKWQFPETLLPAQSYLVVFASGRDTNVAGQLHTNFKLAASGGYLALVDAATNVVSQFAPAYPPQLPDVSYGCDRLDPSLVGYFVTPTPGAPNATCGLGFASAVQFSRGSGTFLTSFTLALSTADANCDLHFLMLTNNVPSGSPAPVNIPTAGSPLYTAPLPIANTAQVRARAFPRQAGCFPGPVHTESYVQLTPAAAAFTSDLPIMLFHNLGGGDVPPASDSVRQSAILMVFEPAAGLASLTNPPALVTQAGLHTRGRITAGLPQHPLSLDFWDDYNDKNDLEFLGLPAEAHWVLYPPDFFDLSLIRNPLIHQLSRDAGRYSPRTRFAECFFNTKGGPVAFSAPAGGDYFGFYTIEEKIRRGPNRVNITKLNPQNTTPPTVTGGYLLKIDSYGSTETTFYDAYAQNPIVFVDPPHRQMASAARRPQLTYISNYFAAFGAALWGSAYTDASSGYAAYIDVDSWIDHHLLECFVQNHDAFRLSGFFFKDRDQKIEMGPMWDLHLTMMDEPRQWRSDGTDFFWGDANNGNGVRWWSRLFTDTEFWQRWIDRWAGLRSGVLTTSHIYAVMDSLGAQLTKAAPREAQRWNYGGGYQQQITTLKSWVATRLNFIDTNLLNAPVLSGNGGAIPSGFALTLTAATREANSTIYYTLDGTDPRLPGGAVSPAAFSNLNTATLTLTKNARVFARNWNPAHHNLTGQGNPPVSSSWSGPTAATFIVATPPLAITEIMYHPAPDTSGANGSDQFEFIELKNVGSNTLDLAGSRFTNGIEFAFTATNAVTNLGPGQYLVLVRNPGAFLSRYPWVTNIAGQYTNTLNVAGEHLYLEGALKEPILDFGFDSQWYPATDGAGFSLVIRNEYGPFQAWSNASSWRASARPGGSPGQADPAPLDIPAVVLNEALSHPGAHATDSIELYNPTGGPASVGGWFLTDNPKHPAKYCIAAGTVIPAGGYALFDKSQFDNNGANSFGLSALGDGAYVFSGDGTNLTGYGHGFEFGAQLKGVTFGRYVTSDGREHFVAQRANTLGGTNAGPKVGPVVINEIMYSPAPFGLAPDTLDEYVELRNFSDQPAPLFDPLYPANAWQLQGAVQFVFPPGSSMPARSYLLVVGFDPIQDPVRLIWFQQRFGIDADIPVFGPYQGDLVNEDLGVGLYQPGEPVAPPSVLAGSVPQVLVEEVHYSSLPPWPGGAQGSGDSLQRLASVAFADDPANWEAGHPTPGAINEGACLVDTDHDGIPDELELLAGTDPLNPQDFLRFDRISVQDTHCVIEFTAHAGRTYAVEELDQIGQTSTWTLIWKQLAGADGSMTVRDPLTVSGRFYRLKVTED
jgi:hypothetical protein